MVVLEYKGENLVESIQKEDIAEAMKWVRHGNSSIDYLSWRMEDHETTGDKKEFKLTVKK